MKGSTLAQLIFGVAALASITLIAIFADDRRDSPTVVSFAIDGGFAITSTGNCAVILCGASGCECQDGKDGGR